MPPVSPTLLSPRAQFPLELDSATAPSIRDLATLDRLLAPWLQAPSPDGADNRSEAAARIREAWQTRAATLDLSGLDLTRIPSVLGSLRHLESLRINDNALTEVPTECAHLPMLTILNLSGNPLSVVPEWIGGLAQLHSLFLDRTKLEQAPLALLKLPRECTVYLRDCPLDKGAWRSLEGAKEDHPNGPQLSRHSIEAIAEQFKELYLQTQPQPREAIPSPAQKIVGFNLPNAQTP